MNKKFKNNVNNSWDNVADWYIKLIDKKGMYFHKNIIFPNLLRLFNFTKDSELIDLACGEGVLSRYFAKYFKSYLGIDVSQELIAQANKLNKYKNVSFKVFDLTQPITLNKTFSHAVCVLAIQNIQNIDSFFRNVNSFLKQDGVFIIVMNHPCFRIPRITSWGIDETKKLQYRRIDRYMSPLNIPINVKPSKYDKRYITWTYHYPLSFYVNLLAKNGFAVLNLEEWVSDKVSMGKYRKMENLARNEIPMFLAIKAIKFNYKNV